MTSLVLTDSSQLTSDSQHLGKLESRKTNPGDLNMHIPIEAGHEQRKSDALDHSTTGTGKEIVYTYLRGGRVKKLPSTHPTEIRASISPVIDSIVHCESKSALDHASTEAGLLHAINWTEDDDEEMEVQISVGCSEGGFS
uniref:(California timema) hypothetical protein n=1 Tax=Timema californicum TaxID=61474 RepID=A0A7R9JKE2_TIMCA|nr:unnamed protein product [Timema californicum]